MAPTRGGTLETFFWPAFSAKAVSVAVDFVVEKFTANQMVTRCDELHDDVLARNYRLRHEMNIAI